MIAGVGTQGPQAMEGMMVGGLSTRKVSLPEDV